MINLKTIEEAFEFVRNGASIKQQDGATGIPITRIETIWDSTIDKKRFGYANIEDIADYKNHLLQHGDILMSHINSPKHLGKCAIYKNNPDTLIHGMNLLNLRPNKSVLSPQFALYFLSSNGFRQEITKISNQSVNQASFSTSSFKKLKISLPPLAEQHKIAAILDAADSLRQKDQQLVERYTTLSQSLFLEMFGDPVTNPMGWERKKLGDVSNKVTDGTHQSPRFLSEGVPFLLVSNIVNNQINFNAKKFISQEDYETLTKNTPIEKDDILYTSVGSYGNPAIVGAETKFCFQRHIAHIKPNHQLVNVKFLHSMLITSFIKNQADKLARGVAQKTINLKEIKSLEIYLPTLKAQNQFAESIKLIEAQKQQAQASLHKSEALFNSLLQQAFTGELTRAPMERAA